MSFTSSIFRESMQHILPPIFQGWKEHTTTCALSRFGAHNLFEVQALRYIQEYAAPLIFQQQPLASPPHFDDHGELEAYQDRIYLNDYSLGRVIIYNTTQKQVVPCFSYRRRDQFVQLFIFRICPTLSQLWCLVNVTPARTQELHIYTLDGQWVRRFMVPKTYEDIRDFAYHPLLKQVLFSRNRSVCAYTWPEFTPVWTETDSKGHIYVDVLAHPTQPKWLIGEIMSRRTGSSERTNTFILSCRLAQGQVTHTINLPFFQFVRHFHDLYLLVVGEFTVLVLSWDMEVLNEISCDYCFYGLGAFVDNSGIFFDLSHGDDVGHLRLFRITSAQ